MLIRTIRPWDVPEREVTDETLYLRRREFLRTAAAATAGAALFAGCGSAEHAGAVENPAAGAVQKPLAAEGGHKFSTDEPQTDFEDATTYNNFYEFGLDKSDPAEHAHSLRTRPWTLSIDGDVAKPKVIGIEDLLARGGLQERIYRLRCVEAWSMVIPWIGFPLGHVIARAQPSSSAKFVELRTLHDAEQMPGQRRGVLEWPYREGLRIDEATHPLAILAVGMYGRELPNQNGAPLRLVVPWKYGFKSIKSIVSIRVTETQPATTWNMSAPNEYGFYANVNPDVDHPRWSQKRERRIGEFRKRETLPFNGYREAIGHLYTGMDLRRFF